MTCSKTCSKHQGDPAKTEKVSSCVVCAKQNGPPSKRSYTKPELRHFGSKAGCPMGSRSGRTSRPSTRLCRSGGTGTEGAGPAGRFGTAQNPAHAGGIGRSRTRDALARSLFEQHSHKRNPRFPKPIANKSTMNAMLNCLLQLGHLPSKRQDAGWPPPPTMPFFQP